MSDFKTARPAQHPLDPYKRVHYSFGLVLGVDDFVQEQTYFLERDKLHQRSLHGYGTVCGLNLTPQGSGDDLEVAVSAGLAVNPQGQSIRVPSNQCARLNTWLARHRDEVTERLGSPPGTGPVTLYVELCSDECLTDQVPIPGGPCRSQQDAMAPSRIADHFQLRLSWEPPSQLEEEAVRRFGELLCLIEVGGPGPFVPLEVMEGLVRDLGSQLASPPASPPELGSPPGEPLQLDPDQARNILQAVFRIWVTEVRPALLGEGRNCAGGPPDESCVLLGQISFGVAEGVGGNFVVDESSIEIDQSLRPLLLHTQLLQEWLMCGRAAAEQEAPIEDHGELQGLGDDDHPHYLLADGTRPLSGDLSAGGNLITDLAAAAAPGDAVRFEQAIKVGDAAGGDLSGTYPDPSVARLQGNDVSGVAPANGQVLTWNQPAGRWAPQSLPPAAGDFVAAPAGPYAIVGAGFFRPNGFPIGPVYNNLQVQLDDPGTGLYALSFDRYARPLVTSPFTYILKGTVQDRRQPSPSRATFQFVAFLADRMLFRVLGTNNEPPQLNFMIEVSRLGEP